MKELTISYSSSTGICSFYFYDAQEKTEWSFSYDKNDVMTFYARPGYSHNWSISTCLDFAHRFINKQPQTAREIRQLSGIWTPAKVIVFNDGYLSVSTPEDDDDNFPVPSHPKKSTEYDPIRQL